MKKLLLSLTATILSVCLLHAQSPVKRYDASYSTGGTYTQLTNTTDLGNASIWLTNKSSNIPLPINFSYQNVPITSFAVETYGAIILNSVYQSIPNSQIRGHLTGINMPYDDGGRGHVYYATTGTAGNRIFKIEYRNMSCVFDKTGTDTLNFQIWLYEQDNAIEYRAGYSNVPDSDFGEYSDGMGINKINLTCGLICNAGDTLIADLNQNFAHTTKLDTVTGQFSDTTFTYPYLYNNLSLFGSYPPNGSVIRFVPVNPNSITAVDFDMAGIYPNPSADGMFTMNMKDVLEAGASLTIYDMTGKEIVKQPVSAQSSTIDLSAYANGYYFGKIINGERTGNFKLIKE